MTCFCSSHNGTAIVVSNNLQFPPIQWFCVFLKKIKDFLFYFQIKAFEIFQRDWEEGVFNGDWGYYVIEIMKHFSKECNSTFKKRTCLEKLCIRNSVMARLRISNQN